MQMTMNHLKHRNDITLFLATNMSLMEEVPILQFHKPKGTDWNENGKSPRRALFVKKCLLRILGNWDLLSKSWRINPTPYPCSTFVSLKKIGRKHVLWGRLLRFCVLLVLGNAFLAIFKFFYCMNSSWVVFAPTYTYISRSPAKAIFSVPYQYVLFIILLYNIFQTVSPSIELCRTPVLVFITHPIVTKIVLSLK